MIVAPRPCTCARFATILALVVALPTLASRAPAQDDKLPAAEKILDKSLQGLGGTTAFEKIRSRVSKGQIEFAVGSQSRKGAVTLYEAEPNKRYQRASLVQLGVLEGGCDGDVVWEIAGGKVSLFEGDELANRLRQGHFNALLHWRDLYEKADCVGKEDVNARSCYKVVLTPLTGSPDTLYFDRKNGYPIRMDITRSAERGPLVIQILSENFKQVDDIWVPFKVTRVVTAQGETLQTVTYTWESIEHNPEIPADCFDLPDAVKQAREKAASKDKNKDDDKDEPAD